MTNQDLFQSLFDCKSEMDVDNLINQHPDVFSSENWCPYGGLENNFSVIENQQSNPVAALVEKLTNAIDATMMRRCYEEGIDPKSASAPSSIEKGIERFFPDHKYWNLPSTRRAQAQNIQVVADGKRGKSNDTSLIIYDNGEGQHPADFENTFLSLLLGNKNEIHFVQGKYNMGGSGAIVFCGKKRYQLLASKRYDGSGEFGFTLIRQHPLTETEAQTKKNTWYEYLKIDDGIPSFPIDALDLGLDGRLFTTGTIIKLYSYNLKDNRHIRDSLQSSLNEFMYAPALPMLMVETKERYPEERVLTSVVHGLQRKLSDSNYVEDTFSERYQDSIIGNMKVTVHIFKTRTKNKNRKETQKEIRKFFKNRMAVQFSLNGQVHGYYTSEFITRSLKFPLLRDNLLIHVDCTNMNHAFRNQLFMASRDRLKQGDEASYLRDFLRDNLQRGRLKEIYKQRKDSISVEGSDSSEDLLKSFGENLPINRDLRQLLSKTFKLDSQPSEKKRPRPSKQPSPKKKTVEFDPQRYPSFFRAKLNLEDGRRVVSIPMNGHRTIQFETDVENNYFERVEDAGKMQIAILGRKKESNNTTGGNDSGNKTEDQDLLSIKDSDPHDGTIRISMKPTQALQVGDEVEVKVDLSSPNGDLEQLFWIKVTKPTPDKKDKVPVEDEDAKSGLPEMIQVFESDEHNTDVITWQKLEDKAFPITMDWDVVMYPLLGENDVLESIYINMDSRVLKDYKSKHRKINQEQINLAHNRYLSAVYFHTIFLYMINRNRQYQISKTTDEYMKETEYVDLADYLVDVFNSHYAAFLLNFGGTNQLMDTLG